MLVIFKWVIGCLHVTDVKYRSGGLGRSKTNQNLEYLNDTIENCQQIRIIYCLFDFAHVNKHI